MVCMKHSWLFTLFMVVALAGPAPAQLPPGLSAADPSQQLKTTGMSLWGHSSHRPVLTSAPLYTVGEARESRPRLSRAERARAAKARARRARNRRR